MAIYGIVGVGLRVLGHRASAEYSVYTPVDLLGCKVPSEGEILEIESIQLFLDGAPFNVYTSCLQAS